MDVLVKFFQLLFSIAILPFVYAAIQHLPSHMIAYPTDMLKLFMKGGGTFIAVFLFLYQGRELQAFGQTVIGKIFSFAPFLQVTMQRIFSFYLLIAVLLYFVVSRAMGFTQFNTHLMFLMGFFFAMHNVLTAVQMQEEDGSKVFKITYLSSFIVVLLVNVVLLILLFDAIKGQFTLVEYILKVVESGRGYYLWAIDHTPFLK